MNRNIIAIIFAFLVLIITARVIALRRKGKPADGRSARTDPTDSTLRKPRKKVAVEDAEEKVEIYY